MTVPTHEFPREIVGLPGRQRPLSSSSREGEQFALRIAPVSKRIGAATVRMLA